MSDISSERFNDEFGFLTFPRGRVRPTRPPDQTLVSPISYRFGVIAAVQISHQRGHFDSKFQVEGVVPQTPTNHFCTDS